MKKSYTKHLSLVINATFLDQVAFTRHFSLLQTALNATGVTVRVYPSTAFNLTLPFVLPPDFALNVLYWDKDPRLAQLLVKAGCCLINTPASIALCDDKWLTMMTLADAGLPVVPTQSLPLLYTQKAADQYFLMHPTFAFPLIAKAATGSFGQQVFRCPDLAALRAVQALMKTPLLIQPDYSSNPPVDYRLVVIGEHVVVTIKRTGRPNGYLTNLQQGAHGVMEAPVAAWSNLAVAACKALGLTFGGVDLIIHNQNPYILEVNSHPLLVHAQQISGRDLFKALSETLTTAFNWTENNEFDNDDN